MATLVGWEPCRNLIAVRTKLDCRNMMELDKLRISRMVPVDHISGRRKQKNDLVNESM